MPKLVAEDIPLLNSLLSDVFPVVQYTPAQMQQPRPGHLGFGPRAMANGHFHQRDRVVQPSTPFHSRKIR